MFQKFKITTYATVLLIGVFVLPYAGNVADVNAENYKCKGSKKQVRQCLKAVISEKDKQIAYYNAQYRNIAAQLEQMKQSSPPEKEVCASPAKYAHGNREHKYSCDNFCNLPGNERNTRVGKDLVHQCNGTLRFGQSTGGGGR